MADIDPKEPPVFGELQFEFALAPVSVQSKAAAKKTLAAAIRASTRQLEYILTGDVSVEVEWLVHARARYESDASPDIDNIIKPLLDSFAGPDGLIIDDCQIRSLGVAWIDWTRSDEQLRISFRYSPDEWTSRAGLRFVQLSGNLCLPFEGGLPGDLLRPLLEHYERALIVSNELDQLVGDYYLARAVLPVQRLFHRTRIRGFPVSTLAALKAELSQDLQR
ncbi:MAG TPA: RusA family crossover junction endodeoxyribonuclease [Thermoanaerobaculia bacterium]